MNIIKGLKTGFCRKVAETFQRRSLIRKRPENLLDFWEKRAAKHGRRAVFNLAHGEKNLDLETDRQAQEIFPFLAAQLSGNERVALDFGCGAGRFSGHLKMAIQGQIIGVDPTKKLLEIAQKTHPEMEYRFLENGQILSPENSFDVVFISLVLGGIPAEELPKTVAEIERVLKPNGLICLVENISDSPDAGHWFFRPAAFYERVFPAFPLKMVNSYLDSGEEIGVFVSLKK